MSELPGPARKRALSQTGRQIRSAMAERLIVARPRRVEDDVTVQHAIPSGLFIDERRADLNRLEVRDSDRAVVIGLARVRRALLR
jgi:hypothetical protein